MKGADGSERRHRLTGYTLAYFPACFLGALSACLGSGLHTLIFQTLTLNFA